MERPILHHSEICVADEKRLLKLLTNGLGFSLTHIRKSPEKQISQWVLKSNQIIFMINKPSSGESNGNGVINSVPSFERQSVKNPNSYPFLRCCPTKSVHSRDTVFNIALEVKSVDERVKQIKNCGGQVIIEPSDLEDQNGLVRIAVVNSACQDVLHTLIDKKRYTGSFLPGFCDLESDSIIDTLLEQPLSDVASQNRYLTTYIDHVTYVCREGESEKIIEFYEKCFGMKRFMTNRQENEAGFVLAGNIGLRLKVMHYWKCAESGVASGDDLNTPQNLKLVLAEPLPEVEESHVQTFLRQHGGPGVQHIGLYSPNMIETVNFMTKRGVPFRAPPSTYYQECGKLKEIQAVGLGDSLSKIQNLGILLDQEEDYWPHTLTEDLAVSKKYLMQIFTYPLFAEDTFFLEVIERRGAMGFGAGNITALARSIQKYQEEMKNKKDKN